MNERLVDNSVSTTTRDNVNSLILAIRSTLRKTVWFNISRRMKFRDSGSQCFEGQTRYRRLLDY